jgi:hypothetical protein
VTLAACGESVILQHPSERTVTQFVLQHTGFRPTDMKCPSGVVAKVGATFDCHFTGPDGKYVAHVRIASLHGSSATDYIVTQRIR